MRKPPHAVKCLPILRSAAYEMKSVPLRLPCYRPGGQGTGLEKSGTGLSFSMIIVPF